MDTGSPVRSPSGLAGRDGRLGSFRRKSGVPGGNAGGPGWTGAWGAAGPRAAGAAGAGSGREAGAGGGGGASFEAAARLLSAAARQSADVLLRGALLLVVVVVVLLLLLPLPSLSTSERQLGRERATWAYRVQDSSWVVRGRAGMTGPVSGLCTSAQRWGRELSRDCTRRQTYRRSGGHIRVLLQVLHLSNGTHVPPSARRQSYSAATSC